MGTRANALAERIEQGAAALAAFAEGLTDEQWRRTIPPDAVRAMSDEELDRAAPVSLNYDAPLATQFFIEDHALRHSFHHLAKLRAALA